jgi:hypothetical protein
MFYLLKNIPYLNIVILKLKCNNLTFNEILILYASYVCLLHSRFIENHLIWILKDRPLIFEVILSHVPIRVELKKENVFCKKGSSSAMKQGSKAYRV